MRFVELRDHKGRVWFININSIDVVTEDPGGDAIMVHIAEDQYRVTVTGADAKHLKQLLRAQGGQR